MYGNVGLPTPRGSGTNGYVVRNLSYIRQHKDIVPYESLEESKSKASSLLNRQPNQEILNHEKKRKVEIECLNYRRQLEEIGKSEEEIEEKVNKLRQKLLSSLDTVKEDKNIQEHQIHQLSKAKATENERMMKALGIKPHEYVEGAAFDRELQEQNKRDRAAQKAMEIEERQKRINDKILLELSKRKDDKKQDDVHEGNRHSVKKDEKKDYGRDYKGSRKNRRNETESNSESSGDSSSDTTESDDSDSDTDHRVRNYEFKGRPNRYEDRDANVIRKRNDNESRNHKAEDYRRTERRLPRSPRRRQSSPSRRHRDASIPTSRRHRDGSLSPIPSRNRESASPYSRRNRDDSFSPPRRRQRDYNPKEDYSSRRKVASHKRSPSPSSSYRRHRNDRNDNVRSRDLVSQRRTEELDYPSRHHRDRSSDVDSSSEVGEHKSSVYKRKRRDDTSDSELDDRRNRRHPRNRDNNSSNSSDSSISKEGNKHPQLLLPEHLQRKRRRGRGRESDSSTYSSQDENS